MSGGKTSWRVVRASGTDEVIDLEGSDRLAALYRLQTGVALPDVRFAAEGRPLGDAGEIDWDGFPMVAALEAVTLDELRRLRLLTGAPLREPPAKPAGVGRFFDDGGDPHTPAHGSFDWTRDWMADPKTPEAPPSEP